MLVVRQRQPVIGQRLLDVVLDPVAQPRIFRLPFAKPLGDVAPHLGNLAPIVKPAQLSQTVVVHPARHIVERVAQEVHIAALPGRLGQDLADRLLEAGMIVADDKLDPGQPARLQSDKKIAPTRSALPVGQLDRQDLPPAILVDRHRNQHRLTGDDPGLAHLLITRVEDQVRVALAQPPLGKRLEAVVERLVDRADR